MKARFITVGDVIIFKGKAAVVKKVKVVSGKVQLETSAGHFSYNPEAEVEVE